MGQNLVTLQEYKAYMGLTSPTQDFALEALITKVSALVKSYCNRSFLDYVDSPKLQHFNGGTGSLILDEGPILEVSAVEYSDSYGQAYITLSEFTDYVQDNEYIVSVNPAGFARQLRGYRVTYLAGYEELPEDLKLAVFDLVTYYNRNDAAVHASKSSSSSSVQVEYIVSTSLPAHIRRVLDLHRADYS